jgi:hypothetical protein
MFFARLAYPFPFPFRPTIRHQHFNDLKRENAMTDSSNERARDSKEAKSINIEIPIDMLEGMFPMMARRGGFGTAGSGCCETTRDMCCPRSDSDGKEEFTFVLKRKE